MSDYSLNDGLSSALFSADRSADIPQASDLYGWLVGSWDLRVLVHESDGSETTHRGAIHAGWVLQGRAIQDVFDVPGFFYGTSVRFYDPQLQAWQVFWMDPMKQVFMRLLGRQKGNDIVNEGKETPELARAYGLVPDPDARIQWNFTDITAQSFRWVSLRSNDGENWVLQREYFGQRRAESQAHRDRP